MVVQYNYERTKEDENDGNAFTEYLPTVVLDDELAAHAAQRGAKGGRGSFVA